jgi:DNA-binding transcriptional MerR regulator
VIRQEVLAVEKGPDAFRTISEVADDLDLPQHVLRFWETRFPQIRPLKRGGGRRYYRPDDIELLRGIRHLLYSEGYTIRGVQRILKEQGPRFVQMVWLEADDVGLADADMGEEIGRDLEDLGIDAGHPGMAADAGERRAARAPLDDEPRGGALGGILNLLPTRRGREAGERNEPSARIAREELPEIVDMPPVRQPEPAHPRNAAPAARESEAHRPFAEDGPVDAMPAFPFRPAPARFEPSREANRELVRPRGADPSFMPLRTQPYGPPSDWTPPSETRAYTPARQPETRPTEIRHAESRASEPRGRTAAAEPSRVNLTRDDIRRLQATLYELQECRRMLDAAFEDER